MRCASSFPANAVYQLRPAEQIDPRATLDFYLADRRNAKAFDLWRKACRRAELHDVQRPASMARATRSPEPARWWPGRVLQLRHTPYGLSGASSDPFVSRGQRNGRATGNLHAPQPLPSTSAMKVSGAAPFC